MLLLAGGAGLAPLGAPWAAERQPAAAASPLRGSQIAPEVAYGLRVLATPVQLRGSTGDAAADAELLNRVEALAGTVRDGPLQRFILDGLMQQVRRLDRVAEASVATFESVPAGRVVVAITVVPAQTPGPPASKVEGLFVDGALASLPVLHQDDSSLFKAILNGGVGAFATFNPFFGRGDLFTRGNKAARDPAGPGRTAWAESYIEPGLGGIAQLGDWPVYAYGSATYLLSASFGQDLYDSGTRTHGAWEQAYAGLLFDLPGKGNSLNLSGGRQIYQLRQGFLISKIPGSTNLGSLGALWLGPRLAFDNTAIAQLKLGEYSLEGIVLEPSEFPGAETNTRIAGATIGYNDSETIDAALTYLEVPRSSRAYLGPEGNVVATRDGLRTVSPSLWLYKLFGVEGLWFKGEFAWQTHESLDMSAYAFAIWPGYRAEKLPWKPGISYKYTQFSGDDPSTSRYERYDPLLAGGQNNYVPGMLLSSVLLNSNLRSQRVTLTANPSESLALTLEYTQHRAIYLNNRGAIGPLQQLSSKDLASELDFFVNLYLGKHLYLQGVLAAARPGAAI